jgi:hypothetical protein
MTRYVTFLPCLALRPFSYSSSAVVRIIIVVMTDAMIAVMTAATETTGVTVGATAHALRTGTTTEIAGRALLLRAVTTTTGVPRAMMTVVVVEDTKTGGAVMRNAGASVQHQIALLQLTARHVTNLTAAAAYEMMIVVGKSASRTGPRVRRTVMLAGRAEVSKATWLYED